jgi:hypothetical protein
MNWLDERTFVCIYRHPETGDELYWEGPWEEKPEEIDGYVYSGFLPDKVNWTIRTQFERNGRIGYEYKLANGKKFIRSATRERYEHNLGSLGSKALKEKGRSVADSVYSRSFQKSLDAKKKETK